MRTGEYWTGEGRQDKSERVRRDAGWRGSGLVRHGGASRSRRELKGPGLKVECAVGSGSS